MRSFGKYKNMRDAGDFLTVFESLFEGFVMVEGENNGHDRRECAQLAIEAIQCLAGTAEEGIEA